MGEGPGEAGHGFPDRIVGLRTGAPYARRVLHAARRPGRRAALALRTGVGLLLHPAHGRGTGTERHLLLRPLGQVRHGPDQGHFQQTPGTSRPITRRTAARPNEAHPENPEKDFGVRFLSGSSSSARGRASSANAPGNRRHR